MSNNKNIDKLHDAIGGKKSTIDNETLLQFQDDKMILEFSFDKKGNKLKEIAVYQKEYACVGETKLHSIMPNN